MAMKFPRKQDCADGSNQPELWSWEIRRNGLNVWYMAGTRCLERQECIGYLQIKENQLGCLCHAEPMIDFTHIRRRELLLNSLANSLDVVARGHVESTGSAALTP